MTPWTSAIGEEAARETARRTAPGLPVTTDLHAGVAADVLITESGTAQLIVVGSRGHGAFTAMGLGSVRAITRLSCRGCRPCR